MLIYNNFFGKLSSMADTGIFWVSTRPKGKIEFMAGPEKVSPP